MGPCKEGKTNTNFDFVSTEHTHFREEVLCRVFVSTENTYVREEVLFRVVASTEQTVVEGRGFV